MKTDTTRSTFRKKKHYSGVRMQQGRVQLDADWNEQIDIQRYMDAATRIDCIGPTGTHQNGGFAIDVPDGGKNLIVTEGQCYVNGILCENEQSILLTAQPDLPNVEMPKGAGNYLAYVDVWQRSITAVEDPGIRETALGGPDTATRTKTVWQVKLTPVESDATCSGFNNDWKPSGADSTCRMCACTEKNGNTDDACQTSPEGGYNRRENQLYRVEIHEGSDGTDGPTFKWSRDNGSIVFKIDMKADEWKGSVLTVSEAGQGRVAKLKPGQWMELSHGERVLNGLPGVFTQLTEVAGNNLTVDFGSIAKSLKELPTDFVKQLEKNKTLTLRLWDHAENNDIALKEGAISVKEEKWQKLENGVKIQFKKNGHYITGDYWLIPARCITNDVEWPQDDDDKPIFDLRHGIKHQYAPLALVELTGAGAWQVNHDCRRLFPALTSMTNLFYLGGDGQEALPGADLEEYLRVRVANGQHPVRNARIKFEILKGNGDLTDVSDTGNKGNAIEIITTKDNEVAECKWTLDSTTPNQQVAATLLDDAGNPHEHLDPIHFNANLSRAPAVHYHPGGRSKDDLMAGVDNVQDGLDRLDDIKVNVAGDTMTGPLVIQDNLTVEGNAGMGADPHGQYRLDVDGILNASEYYQNGQLLNFRVSKVIEQENHEFKVGQAIYFNGEAKRYMLARSDNAATTGMFLVAEVEKDTPYFTLVQAGYVSGLEGLIAGKFYYVSKDKPGELIPEDPSLGISNPLLLAISETDGFVLHYRPGGRTEQGSASFSSAQQAPNDAVFVDKDGQVGIGTTSPGAKLHICDNTNTEWAAIIKQSSTVGYGLSVDASAVTHGDPYPLAVYTNKGTGLFVKTSGRVGIGTTNPQAALHVSGDIIATGKIQSDKATATRTANDMLSLSFGGLMSPITGLEWIDMPDMDVTVSTGANPVAITFSIGGVEGQVLKEFMGQMQDTNVRFRILVDENEWGQTAGSGNVSFSCFPLVSMGVHIIKIQWNLEALYQNPFMYQLTACKDNASRNLTVFEL